MTEEAEDKGHVRYFSPKNHLIQRGFGLFFIGLGWVTAGAVVYVTLTGQIAVRPPTSPLLLWFLVPFMVLVLLWMPILGATVFLHPTFNIYEHGLTTPVQSVMSSTKEGRFIHFSRMRAYERWWKRPHQITVYISETEHVTYSHLWKEVMDRLAKELKAKGIPEMPSHCSKCRKELHFYGERCPDCEAPVFHNE